MVYPFKVFDLSLKLVEAGQISQIYISNMDRLLDIASSMLSVNKYVTMTMKAMALNGHLGRNQSQFCFSCIELNHASIANIGLYVDETV